MRRTCSLTPQAADSSSVGSSRSNTGLQPGLPAVGEGVVAAEQQRAVRPRRVDLAAPAVLTVADQPLPHPGHASGWPTGPGGTGPR